MPLQTRRHRLIDNLSSPFHEGQLKRGFLFITWRPVYKHKWTLLYFTQIARDYSFKDFEIYGKDQMQGLLCRCPAYISNYYANIHVDFTTLPSLFVQFAKKFKTFEKILHKKSKHHFPLVETIVSCYYKT